MLLPAKSRYNTRIRHAEGNLAGSAAHSSVDPILYRGRSFTQALRWLEMAGTLTNVGDHR